MAAAALGALLALLAGVGRTTLTMARHDSLPRFPNAVQVVGAAGCAALALTLPVEPVAADCLVFLVNALYPGVRRTGDTGRRR